MGQGLSAQAPSPVGIRRQVLAVIASAQGAPLLNLALFRWDCAFFWSAHASDTHQQRSVQPVLTNCSCCHLICSMLCGLPWPNVTTMACCMACSQRHQEHTCAPCSTWPGWKLQSQAAVTAAGATLPGRLVSHVPEVMNSRRCTAVQPSHPHTHRLQPPLLRTRLVTRGALAAPDAAEAPNAVGAVGKSLPG